jgi:hypothetical protein
MFLYSVSSVAFYSNQGAISLNQSLICKCYIIPVRQKEVFLSSGSGEDGDVKASKSGFV